MPTLKEKLIGPYGQNISVSHIPYSPLKEYQEYYPEDGISRELLIPSGKRTPLASLTDIQKLPFSEGILSQLYRQRVTIWGNGVAAIFYPFDVFNYKEQMGPLSIATKLNRMWTKPRDGSTIDFTTRVNFFGKTDFDEVIEYEPVLNMHFLRARYQGDDLFDIQVVTGHEEQSGKYQPATGSIDLDIPNLLKISEHTPEAVKDSFSFEAGDMLEECKHDLVAQALKRAERLTDKFLPFYFPNDNTKAYYLGLLDRINWQKILAEVLFRHTVYGTDRGEEYHISTSDIAGGSKKEIPTRAIDSKALTEGFNRTKSDIKAACKVCITGLSMRSVWDLFSMTHFLKIGSTTADWQQYQVEVGPGKNMTRYISEEGNSQYPVGIPEKNGTTTIERSGETVVLVRTTNKAYWRAEIPATIPSEDLKETIFDMGTDLRVFRQMLKTNFKSSTGIQKVQQYA